jgi:diacylglycerol kinase (ATP)
VDHIKGLSDQTWALLVNPSAGAGRCIQHIAAFKQQLYEAGIPFEMHLSQYSGHISELAYQLACEGVTHFMVAGGDGSVHEALNGAMRFSQLPGRFTFASVPLGTANDWARYYGIGSRSDVIEAIVRKKIVFQDAGRIDWLDRSGGTDWFINVLGVGFDAFVAQVLEQKGKNTWGKASYLYTLLTCLKNYTSRPIRVETDRFCTEKTYFTINAGITSFSGNGMQIVPHAIADDGLLAVTSIAPMGLMEVLFNIFKLYKGKIGQHPKVTLSQEKSISLFSSDGSMLLVEADGELLKGGSCKITCATAQIQTVYVKLPNRKCN